MKIVLKVNVDKLGQAGDIVDVSDGHARNFLIPKDMAEFATDAAIEAVKKRKEMAAKNEKDDIEGAKKVAIKLNSAILKIPVKVGEEGKLFGAVTARQIAERIKIEYKIDISDDKIEMDEENIKKSGKYAVRVKLAKGVQANLKIVIQGE